MFAEDKKGRDLFGSSYEKSGNIFKDLDAGASTRFQALSSISSANSGGSDDAGGSSNNTPRRTGSGFSLDSPNMSLATINMRTRLSQQQQQQQQLQQQQQQQQQLQHSHDLQQDPSFQKLSLLQQQQVLSSAQDTDKLFSAGSSTGQPVWFNNPKRRTIPTQAVDRQTFVDVGSEAPASFLKPAKPALNAGLATGFNSLSFGTRRNNTQLATHDLNTFSDELPPLRTISDLKRDETDTASTSATGNGAPGVAGTDANTSVLSGLEKDTAVDSSSQHSTPFFQKSYSMDTRPQRPAGELAHEKPRDKKEEKTESAVLVFGYPESIANYVIKHFAKFGNILEDFEAIRIDPLFSKKTKNYPIFTGNGWVKLTYDNKASAIRALEESGHVFHGSIIGCVAYSKQAIENIASISINNSDNIGEIDISMTPNNDLNSDVGLMNFNANSAVQKIKLKTVDNDKIFIKSDKDLRNRYTPHAVSTNASTSKTDSLLGKVNNWLFGWDDL